MTELPARSICSPRGKGRWLGNTAVIVRARGHHRGAAGAQSSSPRFSRKAAESFGPLRRTGWLSPCSGQHGWEKVLSTAGRWVLDPGLCSVGQGWVVVEGHGKPGARGLQGSWGCWVIPVLFPAAVGTEGALGAHGHEGSAPKAATAPWPEQRGPEQPERPVSGMEPVPAGGTRASEPVRMCVRMVQTRVWRDMYLSVGTCVCESMWHT